MIQFTMSSEALLERLQMLSKVLSTKSPTPVLSYFLFRVENNDLMLRASDSELTLTTHLEVQNQGEAGSIAVGQRYMMDFLREIGSQPICFAADAHTFSISITTAQGKFQFMGQSAAEYPEPVKVEADKHSFVVPAASMCTAIQQAQFAMVNDPLRPMFAGLYFSISPERFTTFLITLALSFVPKKLRHSGKTCSLILFLLIFVFLS